ncbi:hypothetical protein CBL_10014 [Carabus blaptoides fortunei]
MKCENVLRKNRDLNELVRVFKNPIADPESIAEAGERILLVLYGYSGLKNVDLQDSDEEEDTETVLQQTIDEIEEEGDEVEEENPTADNLEELPIREVLLSSEDEELAKPGPPGIVKRRIMR